MAKIELSDKEKVVLELLKKPSLADTIKNFTTSIYEINKQKVEHELSQKPTITQKLDYWAEIKDDLSIEDLNQIYDKHIQNYLSTNDGSYWSLVSKAKEYEIHFIRGISYKLNSEFAINLVRSEIKAMETIENEVKQLLDTGVDIEQAYKDFKYHFDLQNQIENAKNGRVVANKEQEDIFRRKEEQLEVYRINTNYYKSKSFNDYSVRIYSKYKFYKPYLEAKLKELEQPLLGTPILENDISTLEKEVINKVVKNPTPNQTKFLKAFVTNLKKDYKTIYAIEEACKSSQYSKRQGQNLYKKVREGSLKYEPLSEILNERKQLNNNDVIG